MNIYTFSKGTFGPTGWEDLEARLDLGIAEFEYRMVTDSPTHKKGDIRRAFGTRNLALSLVPFDAIPLGLRTPPNNVVVYFDLWRSEWRCFDKNHLIDYGEDVIIDE